MTGERTVEAADYLPYLKADGEALTVAARRAPGAAVPSCPEWEMPDLLGHVGRVHRWVRDIVAKQARDYRKATASPPGNFDARLEWYEEGLAQLLDTLNGADGSVEVWNWGARAAAPVGFWYRRMAHETAVHRWDGEAAAGGPQPIAGELAADGIDEFLGFVSAWLTRDPVPGLSGSLHLHATDAPGEWSLRLQPDRLDATREHSKASAAIRGPVSDLFLWLVNRMPADSPGFEVFGDRELIDCWRQLKF